MFKCSKTHPRKLNKMIGDIATTKKKETIVSCGDKIGPFMKTKIITISGIFLFITLLRSFDNKETGQSC